MSDEEPNFEPPDPPEPDEPGESPELPDPEQPPLPEPEEDKQPTVSVEEFAALKQMVAELQMKQRRDDDVDQVAAETAMKAQADRIAALEADLAVLQQDAQKTPPDANMDFDPSSKVFIADDDGTDTTEQVVSGASIAPFVDGRSIPTADVVTLSDSQAAYLWLYNASDNKMQAVKVSAGGGSSSAQQYKITTGISGGTYGAKTWDGTTLGSVEFQVLAVSHGGVGEIVTAIPVGGIAGIDLQEITRNSLFPVLLVQTGGSAGDKTTQCNFTYTIKDPSGTYTYATGMSPAFARRSVGKYVAATKGAAYFNGGIALWICDEVPTTGGC